MIFFLVSWIGLHCPGGLLSGLIPHSARPLICQKVQEHELFDRREAAQARVIVVGAGARLFEYRGLRRREIEVLWSSNVTFGR
jgi:hypothetical protein